MEEANLLVPISMFGCIVVFLALFALLPPRRALLVSFLGAWLFLPMAVYEINRFPDYSKLFATGAGILLAVFIFDFKRLINFRPKWVDIPMLIWCLVPLGASITNFGLGGAGIYDGFSEMLAQIIKWGVPYFLGRIYFKSWEEISELAIAIIVSGLIYVPFILVELRMSPQFHNWIYGYHQHLFDQTKRFGRWRPMVFMQHGLMLSFWISTTAILAFWMWRSKSIKSITIPFGWLTTFLAGLVFTLFSFVWREKPVDPLNLNPFNWLIILVVGLVIMLIGIIWYATSTRTTTPANLPLVIPFGWIAAFFVGLTIMMVSVNAWVALLFGISALLASTQFRTRWILAAMTLIAPFYATMQSLNVWPTDLSVDFITGLLGEDRAQSLEFRYFNEGYLTEKALEQPVFGWAGWDRQQVTINDYGLRTVSDSMWITFFGKFGVIGLISLMLSILLPAIVFIGRYPPWLWSHPKLAPAAALSVILVLYMLDGLLNAMINPLFMLAAGAIHGAYVHGTELELQPEKAQPPAPARPQRVMG